MCPGRCLIDSRRCAVQRELFCVIGVNERESERPGTLYNTIVYLGPDGVLARHRKLMPTQHERLFHGIGAGDDLAVVEGRRCSGRRLDLLGEPNAARPLRGLPRRAPDLGRADGRRQRRLAGVDAPHRDRVGRVRRVGAAVHPGVRVPGRFPRPAPRGQGRVRPRRRA